MTQPKSKTHLRLEEVAAHCGLKSETILHFVSVEWLQPMDSENHFFDEEDVARIRLIWELKENLGVNDDAIPIVLHLIDQLNRIHLELK